MNKSRMIHLERFSSSFDLSYDAVFADLPDFDLDRFGSVLGSWNSANLAGMDISDASAVSFLDDPATPPPNPIFIALPLGGNPLLQLPLVLSGSEAQTRVEISTVPIAPPDRTKKLAGADGDNSLPHPPTTAPTLEVVPEVRGEKGCYPSTTAVADDQVSMRLMGGGGRKQRGREGVGEPGTSPRKGTGVAYSNEQHTRVPQPETVADLDVAKYTGGMPVSPRGATPDAEREGKGGRLPPLLPSSTAEGTSSDEEEGKRGRSASTEALTKRGGTMRKKKMKGRGGGAGLLRGVSIPEGGGGEDWEGAVAELLAAVDQSYEIQIRGVGPLQPLIDQQGSIANLLQSKLASILTSPDCNLAPDAHNALTAVLAEMTADGFNVPPSLNETSQVFATEAWHVVEGFRGYLERELEEPMARFRANLMAAVGEFGHPWYDTELKVGGLQAIHSATHKAATEAFAQTINPPSPTSCTPQSYSPTPPSSRPTSPTALNRPTSRAHGAASSACSSPPTKPQPLTQLPQRMRPPSPPSPREEGGGTFASRNLRRSQRGRPLANGEEGRGGVSAGEGGGWAKGWDEKGEGAEGWGGGGLSRKEMGLSGARGKLPRMAAEYMQSWVLAHWDNPKPTREEKLSIAAACGIEKKQVDDWFVNARARWWKPLTQELVQDLRPHPPRGEDEGEGGEDIE